MEALEPSFDRLVRAAPRRRAPLARALARRGEDWAALAAQFNRIHLSSPEHEAPAARALREAYVKAGDRLTAARLRMIEARAIHRVGSPRDAAAAFEVAALDLSAAGDGARAVQAQVVRVDALAVAGRVDEALALAATLPDRLEGPNARLWRNVLRVNEANVLRLRGDLDGALRRYDEASRAFGRLGQAEQAAIARMNAGVALLDGGRGEEALARFERAAEEFAAVGATDQALEARYNRACALVRSARLGAGVRALEQLIREHEERKLPRREALCRVDLADALLRAGDALSAQEEAERAAKTFAGLGAHAERCEALLLAATAAPARAEADALLRRAHAAATASGRPSVVLRCELVAEDARHRRGKGSTSAIARIARRAAALHQTEIVAQAELLLGEAALEAGRPGPACDHFRRAARSARGRPWIRAAAVSGLSTCLSELGQRSRALVALRTLGEFLDAVRSRLPGPWLRATFVLRRLDPWLGRVDILLGRGTEADRAEAEAQLDAIAARRFLERARPRAAQRAAAHGASRLEALYDLIGRGAGAIHGITPEDVARAEAEARRLERLAADAWRSSERSGPVGRSTPTTGARASKLRRDEAVLHVWVRNGRARALYRRGRQIAPAVDLGPTEELLAELGRIAFHADRVRLFGPAGAQEALARQLRTLGARLLGPLERDGNVGALHLVLDPDLPDVPWESLPFRGAPLASTVALLRVPSLRTRRAARRAPGPTTFLAAEDGGLPGLELERARLGRSTRQLVGERATREALADALARPGVVHVAGHGLSSAAAPALGGIRLADGWFAPADVPAVVRASVVVLAACRSGLEGSVAAHAWGGFPAALLASGARRVLWCGTDVDDDAIARLTPVFHRALRRAPAEVALGRALVEVGEDPRVAASLLPVRLSGLLP